MKVGIIGYGKMGRNIFTLFGDGPMSVTVLDVDAEEMERNSRRIEKRFRRAVKEGTLSEADLPERLAAVRFTTSWDELAGCDLVIESVFENLDVKIDVLRRAEAIVSPRAVLTTNTSSLSIDRMARELVDPSRFCGFHFFHPIQLTTIVEIITGQRTSPRIVEFLRGVSRQINRTPLVVGNHCGSAINVALALHTVEALYVLEQGIMLPSQIDEIAGRFGRLGPCEGLDVVGIQFFTEILQRTLDAFPFGHTIPELCHKLVRDGRFGKYANAGIYLYRDDRPVDDAREYYLNPGQTHTRPGVRCDASGLLERLLFSIYYTLLRLAALGVADLGDLCLGISDLIGLKLDPLAEMRKLGETGLREVFERLNRELGGRFDPAPLAPVLAKLDGSLGE